MFELLAYFNQEMHYVPMQTAFDNYGFISSRVYLSEVYPKVQVCGVSSCAFLLLLLLLLLYLVFARLPGESNRRRLRSLLLLCLGDVFRTLINSLMF